MSNDVKEKRGRGRPKGSLSKSTLKANEQKELAREELRALIRPHLKDITEAQIANAKGISYMVLRREDGTYARATDEKEIDRALAEGSEAFQVFTQAPHQPTASMLLGYAADKPVEPVEHTGDGGGALEVTLTERLRHARKRAAERKA